MDKDTQLVVYKNEFNTVPLRNFTSVEMDLLFTIMSQMRDKGLTEMEFTFNELKHLSNYNKETAIQSFINDLEKTYDKLIKLDVKIGTEKNFTKFVFFTRYSINSDKGTISIKVNEDFAPLINELTGNFTKFELEEITNLKSSYSKSCYRLLKQFRKTGYFKIDIDQFRDLLDVPKSYNMSNLTKRVLDPIQKELPQYFKGLKVHKEKNDRRNKRIVSHIVFIFEPQNDIKKTGYTTFRNEQGDYEEKHLYNFTDEEIEKEFPEAPRNN